MFTLTGGRLIDPSGRPFRSIGISHADDANLRYPHNQAIWRERYGGSRRRWLREGLAPTRATGARRR